MGTLLLVAGFGLVLVASYGSWRYRKGFHRGWMAGRQSGLDAAERQAK